MSEHRAAPHPFDMDGVWRCEYCGEVNQVSPVCPPSPFSPRREGARRLRALLQALKRIADQMRQTVSLETAIKCSATNLQDFGGFQFIAFNFSQYADYMSTFYVLQSWNGFCAHPVSF